MMLKGLMQNNPLLISDCLTHAAESMPKQKVITNTTEGGVVKHTYAEIAVRAKKLAQALLSLGVNSGDRVATIAWNTHRHLEAYYGISGIGAVIHTINPRLFHDQLVYIINEGGARILLVDKDLLPLVENLKDELPLLETVVVLTDEEHLPKQSVIPSLLYYETLLSKYDGIFEWPVFDENTACGLCYTSGTTGNPKGVLYSHRSNVIHALVIAISLGVSMKDKVMAIVPLFHVNAWGLPYACLLTGSNLLLPGSKLMGQPMLDFVQHAKPNWVLGVPTVLRGLVDAMDTHGVKKTSLKHAVLGGSSHNEGLHRDLLRKGIRSRQAWGMTETSPLGSFPFSEDGTKFRSGVGKPAMFTQLSIQDDDNNLLPRDGQSRGRLMIRSPYVVERYFKKDDSALTNGWFDTGDMAKIDQDGEVTIVDRVKDVIKSGGEWISSVDLENEAMKHKHVQLSCAIGVSHPKWDERPLLLVVKASDSINESALKLYLSKSFSRWQLPDRILFVDEIPLTATGKYNKKKLKDHYQDFYHQMDDQNKRSA